MFVRIRTRKLSPAFPPQRRHWVFFIAVSINRRVIVFGETPLGDDGKPRLINTGPQPIVATQHIEPG